MRWTQQEYDAYLARRCAKYSTYGVAPSPVSQRSAGDESVAEASGEDTNPAKCVVRIKSFRSRLIDGDNLHAKAFVDALQTAGAIYDDSPKWCKVEVEQVQVDYPWQQRTVIEITYP